MLGIVVGLAAEARLARGLGCPIEVGGGSAAGAKAAAERLIGAGATALISFGLAGGLAPGLAAGSVVVPQTVVDGNGGVWQADPELVRRLGGASGRLLATDAIISTAAAKAAAWRLTGASAADIETAAVTGATMRFAVLRAICDPAERDLPAAAVAALDLAGRIRPAALVRSLIGRPGQIPALLALGREAASARRALLDRVAQIGPLTPP